MCSIRNQVKWSHFLPDTTLYINEIAKQKILVPMVVSCKSEDVEIAFWAVALLHEFAVHSKPIICANSKLKSSKDIAWKCCYIIFMYINPLFFYLLIVD